MLTFSVAGPTEQCLDLVINEDDLVEGLDEFEVGIGGAIRVVSGQGSIRFNIRDLSSKLFNSVSWEFTLG